MLTQFGVCEATTGLRDVTRELKFRVKSFVDRLQRTRLSLDLRRTCYRQLDKVRFYFTVDHVRDVNLLYCIVM